MILTGASLLAVAVLVGGAKIAKSQSQNPKLPFWFGLGLTVLIPTLIISLVLETIFLLSWNPLIWME